MSFKEAEYQALKESYTKEFKKIQNYESRRILTPNPELLQGYKRDIVIKHNFIANYLRTTYDSLKLKGRAHTDKAQTRIIGLIATTKRAFNVLNLEYDWPESEFDDIIFFRKSLTIKTYK